MLFVIISCCLILLFQGHVSLVEILPCTVREKIFEHETVTISRADVLQPFLVAPGTFLLFLGK